MESLLFTASTGLSASQQMLDVAGNNLANSNTTGFKAQEVSFSDLVYQTLNPATGPGIGSLSGTDPQQVGQGVQVASIQANLQQGTLQSTGNPLDFGIQGNGYFVASNGTQTFYTRAGSFGVDSQHYLIDPSTGYRIQRFGAIGEGTPTSPAFQTAGNADLLIPYGAQIPGKATSTITVQGNLPATAKGPQAEVLTSTAPFKSGGSPATSASLLNALSDNASAYQNGDNLLIQGTTASGAAVNSTLAVGPATTLGDLLNAINTNFPGSTASLDASGNLLMTANQTGASSLALTVSDAAGDKGSTPWSNHNLTVTTTGTAGDTANAGIQFYDSQGVAHSMSLVFQKQANNTWKMTASLPQNDGTMVTSVINGISFNSDGSFSGVTGSGGNSPSLTVTFPNLPKQQQINFSFGTPSTFSGLTQDGTNSTVAATGQDGYASGTLTTVNVGQDGVINGVFSNGQILQVAQLALANFANPQGLTRDGQNYLSVTSQSGTAQVGAAVSGGLGSISQGSLESSNVDVSVEFTNLIIAQRAFQLNARAVTTGDQVLQTLVNMLPQ